MERFFGVILTFSIMIWSPLSHSASPLRMLEIEPYLVTAETKMIRGPHIALSNSARSNGLLLLSLGGTQSYPSDFKVVDQIAAQMGFHVLAVDYPNTTITTNCRSASTLSCYDQFRIEVVEGIEASPLVQVDYENSIMYRIESLIRYMVSRDPEGSWSQFLVNEDIDWSRIVLVGHSQGSGHAAYIAKNKPVRGVIMLAGPQDADTRGIAPWVQGDHITPSERYFSFLHEKDHFGVDNQIAVARALHGDPNAAISEVEDSIPANALGPIFVSDFPVKDAHNDLRGSAFAKIWPVLLKRAAVRGK